MTRTPATDRAAAAVPSAQALATTTTSNSPGCAPAIRWRRFSAMTAASLWAGTTMLTLGSTLDRLEDSGDMSELAVITPSFRGDAEMFAYLYRSVRELTPPDTVHHVFVPLRDKPLFARYEGPRCRIRTSSEVLPRRYLRVGRGDSYVDIRRPWPPVRGWITQQALKLAAAAQLDADVVLIADSDVVLVRPVRADRFIVDGQRRLYRQERAVTAEMERHVIWHRV
ncbi:MAG: hypothetical protein J2P15_04495, partial [Micromonosporaceae bacterium]|nr:hypothetical protein [Micromonosporaceae bacterium]